MAVSPAVGYACSALAVLMFGTNFLPVKKIDAGDGIWFGWCMSLGIMLVAIIVDISPLTTPGHHYDPMCLLGGATWAMGNMAGPIIIQKIGMGMAVTVWGLTNMLMGWATGHFGLFGINKQTVTLAWLNYLGVALALLSGVFFGLVKPEDSEEEKGEALLATSAASEPKGTKVMRRLSSVHMVHDVQEHSEVTPVEYAVSFAGALMAGLFFGSMFDIATLDIQGAPGNGLTSAPLDYILTQASGIFVLYSIVLLVYLIVKGKDAYIKGNIIVPAAISGSMWAVAFTSWNIANNALSLVIAFPIITTGPSVVGMAIGIIVFREYKQPKNLALIAVAFFLAISGVICISQSM